jgi:SAM-dependent methyltransferase
VTNIINWNEFRKAIVSDGHRRRGHENPGEMWDKRAEEFNRSTRGRSERTDRQVASLKLDPDYTVLDVGAGTGRLSVPIAKIVNQVTAVDQSRGMLGYLEENMAGEGLSNYKAIQKRWEDVEIGVDIEPHDVVIASHSLGMFDLQEALAKMDAAAKRRVYIFTAAGKWFFDDMEEELWERVYDRPPRRGRGGGFRSDYMLLYNILHDMGIYANVEIRDTEHVQRYGSLDEAVERWKARREIAEENVPLLREYLAKNLEREDGDGLTFRRRTKSAMIWWPKSESS